MVEVLTAHKGNYVSFVEAKEDAEVELQRYLGKEFAVELSRHEVQSLFKRGSLSRLGLIIKIKQDSTKKLRIIVDIRRAGLTRRR